MSGFHSWPCSLVQTLHRNTVASALTLILTSPLLMESQTLSKHQIYIPYNRLDMSTQMMHGLCTLRMPPTWDLNTCSIFWFIQKCSHPRLASSNWTQNSAGFTSEISQDFLPSHYPSNSHTPISRITFFKITSSRSHVYWPP